MKSRIQCYLNVAARIISRAGRSRLLPTASIECLGLALTSWMSGFRPVQAQERNQVNFQSTRYTIRISVLLGQIPTSLTSRL